MKPDQYHPSLRPLEEACRLAESDWICLRNPLVGFGERRSLIGKLLWKGAVMLRHAALVFRCWAVCSHPHILIREFSTWPLLLVFPLLLPLRRKLFFVIHHNLQWAASSRIERAGFTALARLGARWVLFETQELAGLEALDIPSGQNLVLPHPVLESGVSPIILASPENTKIIGLTPPARPVIGVAGYNRPEKGSGELLKLLAECFPDCELMLGTANPETISGLPGVVQIVDTASDEAYSRMLAQCDVLVQNSASNRYFYRVSGPVADAAACGTAVIAPDFPLLQHQITSPVPVGEVFQRLEKMPQAVQTAIESARAGKYDFAAYCAARSAQALAECLDRFSRRRQDG